MQLNGFIRLSISICPKLTKNIIMQNQHNYM